MSIAVPQAWFLPLRGALVSHLSHIVGFQTITQKY